MPQKSHSIADHALGALHRHDHGHEAFDHDHDHDFPETERFEPVAFVSMGLDIGSSSTQVAFSRLKMRGAGRADYDRQTLFLSPVSPTPYNDGRIDEARLRKLIAAAFENAGLTSDDIETGVVILTGEAAAQDNAQTIAHLVSEDVGDLVCAAAGHHMEAMLSARGSGALEASREETGRRILLIDVGGATTKLAVLDNGRVTATAALSAGGRLLVIDRDNRIRRLDPAGAFFAEKAGLSWWPGETIDPAERNAVAEAMTDAILAAVCGEAPDPLVLTPPLGRTGPFDGMMMAGGVAEYVYGRETRDFSDLGRALGAALKRRIEAGAFPCPLLPPGECIRATVLGASAHSLQLSGDTIFISSHADLLPCRNVPVVHPGIDLSGEAILPADVAATIRAHLETFDRKDASQPVALSLPWEGPPAYERIRSLAEGIMKGLSPRIDRRTPLYILIAGDIALSLGKILKEELRIAAEVMVVDGVETADFDFVDIGRVRLPSHTVPVTIKSLVFGGRQP
jgi:ethanolamine utilization protein EutA